MDSAGSAVFLDRDGTLIREVNHLERIEQVEILPGVPDALRLLRDRGYKLIVVTNQSVVARGRLSEAGLGSIHDILRARLACDGALLDAIYYCPHHPTEGEGQYRVDCRCRKPKTGMVDQAAQDFQIEPRASYLIGDQAIDIELAQRVGAQGILIDDGSRQATEADFAAVPVVASLLDAARWIVARENLRVKPGDGQ